MLDMGLAPLKPACWIEPDDQLPQYHQNKIEQRRLLGDRVYRALPESLPAVQELHGLLLNHLCTDHGDCYRMQGDRLLFSTQELSWAMNRQPSLWQASLWVQDDICVLQPSPLGYRLVAASLCAASYWRLEEKVGRPLAAIHQPVPGLAGSLGPGIDRVFEQLKVERPVWRSNWSLVSSNALNQRGASRPPVAADAPVYLRVERQSLRRLPATAAVVFTIRVYVHPLQQVRADAHAWNALAEALRGLSLPQWKYKSVDEVLPALNELGMELAPPQA